MTIIEKNRLYNTLITTGYAERQEENDSFVFKYSLDGNIIHVMDRFARYDINVDWMINDISCDARRAYYIKEVLKSVGIIIDDLEEKYNVIASTSFDIVFCKKDHGSYTFIEFYDDSKDEYGKNIRIVKLDLNTNNLTYDHVNISELKYYHADSKISEFTLSKVENWQKVRLTQNHLYDVMAADVKRPQYKVAWTAMINYGEYVCDLDIKRLDKNICEIDYTYEKPRIYYL